MASKRDHHDEEDGSPPALAESQGEETDTNDSKPTESSAAAAADSKVPAGDDGAKVVTPERKKAKLERPNVEEENEQNDKKPAAESDEESEVVVADDEKVQEKAKQKEEEEPSESSDEEAEVQVNGDTVIDFGKHAGKTFRFVFTNDEGYVRWARGLDSPSGPLQRFVDWTKSTEAHALEGEMRGKEVFGFGQHRGKTFRWIAEHDATYHRRYLHMQPNNKNPVLLRYVDWFKEYGEDYVIPEYDIWGYRVN